jgi:hypothetical protein
MRSLSLLLACALAVPLRAQAHGPAPDARLLQLGTDSLAISLVRDGQRRPTGFVIDRLDTARVDGELRLRRVYRTTDALLGNGVDTLLDQFPSLSPRTVSSRSDRAGSESLTWRNGHIVGVAALPGQPEHSIDTTVSPAVYGGASFDLILRSSPLAVGYTVVIPAYVGRQGSQTLTARVAASESVPGTGETWRVEADFAGLPVTFWIAKNSRRLVRQVITVGPNAQIEFDLAPGRAV